MTVLELEDPRGDFPSFSEGLSLRLGVCRRGVGLGRHFPSFSEGLSLRAPSSC